VLLANLVGAAVERSPFLRNGREQLVAKLAIPYVVLAVWVRACAVVVPLSVAPMHALLSAARHELLVHVLLAVLMLLVLLLLGLHVLLGVLLSLRVVCLLGLGGMLLHGFFGFLVVQLEHLFILGSE